MEELNITIPEYTKGLDEYIEPLSQVVTQLRAPFSEFDSPTDWLHGTLQAAIELKEQHGHSTYWAEYDPQALYTAACTRLLRETKLKTPQNQWARRYLDDILDFAAKPLPEEHIISEPMWMAVKNEVMRRTNYNLRLSTSKAQLNKVQDLAKFKAEMIHMFDTSQDFLDKVGARSGVEIKSDEFSIAMRIVDNPLYAPRDDEISDVKKMRSMYDSLEEGEDLKAEDYIILCKDTPENKRHALLRLALNFKHSNISTQKAKAIRSIEQQIKIRTQFGL